MGWLEGGGGVTIFFLGICRCSSLVPRGCATDQRPSSGSLLPEGTLLSAPASPQVQSHSVLLRGNVSGICGHAEVCAGGVCRAQPPWQGQEVNPRLLLGGKTPAPGLLLAPPASQVLPDQPFPFPRCRLRAGVPPFSAMPRPLHPGCTRTQTGTHTQLTKPRHVHTCTHTPTERPTPIHPTLTPTCTHRCRHTHTHPHTYSLPWGLSLPGSPVCTSPLHELTLVVLASVLLYVHLMCTAM